MIKGNHDHIGGLYTMSQFAYIRVSTKEQSIDRQILALEPYGIPRKMFSATTSRERILSGPRIRDC